MADKDALGRAGEERAAAHLARRGWRVLERNWRCRDGELDIVALDRDELVVVEVKTRSSLGYGHPLEAIDRRKRARLWSLAMAWAVAHPDVARGRDVRIDAIAVIGPDPRTARVEHVVDLR
ncbi:MAG: YraN family protein [Microbacterium sp.]|uniref:YraN family protein n=1 Tax=Microbacterium sp. TaxID=51671 RepID=UPI0039E2DF08